jgi:hypothetical protein
MEDKMTEPVALPVSPDLGFGRQKKRLGREVLSRVDRSTTSGLPTEPNTARPPELQV